MNEPLDQHHREIKLDDALIDSGFKENNRTQKSSYAIRTIILLISFLLVFLSTPSGRKWLPKFPVLKSNQEEKVENFSSITILPVETLKAKLVDSYQVYRTYTGTIFPRRVSSLGFERSGKLQYLAVDLGDRVEAGTPLAFLDTKKIKAQQKELLAERKQVNAQLKELQAGSRSESIAAAKFTVQSVQSQLNLAQSKRTRRQELYTSGAINREQLDESIAEVDTLQARLNQNQSKLDELLKGTRPEKIEAQYARLEQLDAKLATLEIELEKSTLKSPFVGEISKRLVDEGSVISSGQQIFSLVENRDMEAHIGIPVNALHQTPVDSIQKLKIGSKTYKAKVISTLPQLDSPTRTLTVILRLDQSNNQNIRSGQVVRLNLNEDIHTSGYWLPTTALVKGVRGLWSCYVLGQPKNDTDNLSGIFQVEQRDVEILHTESERVFVRGTLQNNDLLIINGNHRLIPGQFVRPLKENA